MTTTNLLDSVLANTESRVNGKGGQHASSPSANDILPPIRIISENNDISTINWVAGMSDPGEMIRCGYLPQLRRQANENDRDYQARLTVMIAALPEKVRKELNARGIGAANARAKIDLSNGKVNVVVFGDPAWHNVGKNVSRAMNRFEAGELGGINFPVEKRQNFHMAGGQMVESTGSFSVVRTDTEAMLANHVGSKYEVIQTADGFDFLDEVMGEWGAKYHTAGSLRGGATVWVQIELPKQAVEVLPGDEVKAYVLWTNSHDGSGKAWCFATNVRAVCWNTHRNAMKGKDKGIGMMHTGNIKDKVKEAQIALGLAVQSFDVFKEEAQVLATTRCPIAPSKYFEGVLDAVMTKTQSRMTGEKVRMGAAKLVDADILAGIIHTQEAKEEAEKKYRRAINDYTSILDDIVARHETERCGNGGGSLWHTYNAISESADHGRLGGRFQGNEHTRQSARFESVVSGRADDVKQLAFAQAKTLAG